MKLFNQRTVAILTKSCVENKEKTSNKCEIVQLIVTKLLTFQKDRLIKSKHLFII